MSAGDFDIIAGLIEARLAALPTEAWGRRTGPREKDWTLHETLAHLVTAAELFSGAADAALNDTPLEVPGIRRREDLAAWNAASIAARVQAASPAALIEALCGLLRAAGERVRHIDPAQADQRAYLRIYNRPARAIDFIDFQLSHAGVIHASQITRPLDGVPLWADYDSELTQRQIDRFMRHFSVAYWPESGPQKPVLLNFEVRGEGGGWWHLAAAPDGGFAGRGPHPDAAITYRFSEPAVLFGVFTYHLPMDSTLRDSRFVIKGDSSEGLNLLRLFSAGPPK